MNFSFQLYSARSLAPLSAIFPQLKALGYAQVEGFGGLYAQADELAAALKSSGLNMPTAHFDLDQLKDISTTLKTARTLGIKTLICPAIPAGQRSKPVDGWKELADTLAELGDIYQGEGFEFGWHNHDFEFAPTSCGELPMDLILKGAGNIVWQCDVAWLVKGAEDPISWIKRYPERIASVHVKDIAPKGECVDEDGWADLGEGTMEWKTILSAIREKTGCASFVLEHDNPSDVMRFATRSIAAANRLWGPDQ